MLDSTTKRRIDDCRDILVGKVPDPKSQIDQITVALIYKFMHDMDEQAVELGGKASFFAKHKIKVVENGKEEEKEVDYAQYAWPKLFAKDLSGEDRVKLYGAALESMDENPGLPPLFRDIFKNTYLPYRDPATLREFLKRIAEFDYDHSEKLGDAFEYLLSIMGSQGDAGQFRTPRHLIDFMTAVIDPQKHETILDPACGTAGFLISAYKHILRNNSSNHTADDLLAFQQHGMKLDELTLSAKKYKGDKITPDQRRKLVKNIVGYDIDPGMVKLSLVNLYLHGFPDPNIHEYDTLTSTDRWEERYDVILANPPFMSPKGGIQPHGKFGIPSNRSEVLFVDYIAEHLNPNGRALVVVPEGIIFQSGKAYKALRKKLVDEHYLVGVVSVPGGVFNPYSGVKTSLLWFDRTLARKTDKLLFVKVEADGFDLGAQRRPIAQNDLPEAFALMMDYKRALADGVAWEAPKSWEAKAAQVEREVIAQKGEYSLSGDRYVSEVVSSSAHPIVALESLCTYVRGVTYAKQDERDSEGKKILRANNINLDSASLDLSDLKLIDSSVRTSEDQRLKANDILICAASGSENHVGKVAFISSDTDLYAGGFMAILRSSELVNPKYLFHVLQSTQFREHIKHETVGANIRNLKASLVLSFQIPLPPHTEQEALVEEVEGYQKVIDGARQVLAHYKPRIAIDPRWEMVELGKLADFRNGLNYTKGEQGEPVKVLGVADFQDHMLAQVDPIPKIIVGSAIGGSQALRENDLVFVRSNGNKELVGRSMIIPAHDEPIFHSGFTIRARFKDPAIAKFMAFYFKAEIHTVLKRGLRSGANISNLSQEVLSAVKIPLPPIDEQKRIVEELEEERRLVAANKELMERMEGKVRERVGRVWGKPVIAEANAV